MVGFWFIFGLAGCVLMALRIAAAARHIEEISQSQSQPPPEPIRRRHWSSAERSSADWV